MQMATHTLHSHVLVTVEAPKPCTECIAHEDERLSGARLQMFYSSDCYARTAIRPTVHMTSP
jgi:hypothetical protein